MVEDGPLVNESEHIRLKPLLMYLQDLVESSLLFYE